MNTTEKATPRPWIQHDTDKDLVCYMLKNDGDYISILECKQWLSPKEREANAALIVKSVNSHDTLVEACKESIKWLQHGQNPNRHRATAILEEALKKAGEL